MKEQFVTYEIALKLKELGYDDLVFCVYHEDELCDTYRSTRWLNENPEMVTKAPLWQQCLDWFREKHGIDIIISSNLVGYGFIIYHRYPPKNTLDNRVFQTYEEAREQAILKCIDLCKAG